MATKGATKRLTKEYKSMVENPPPFIEAHPSESNILEWHYLITGPPNTAYEGGQYHGMLIFPRDYPFKPPEIRMITPNGRFQINTRLCLSMSDYHPDTWQPAWSVATILNGLLSFMTGNEPTTGSIVTSDEAKRRYAKASWEWNAKESERFKREFPNKVLSNLSKVNELIQKEQEHRRAEEELIAQQKAEKKDDGVDLDKMDPEDRIRYLDAQRAKKLQSTGRHIMVYYVLAIALVIGFFRVVT
jgi:ubiquitin-conjugating enzyme E2 J2